MEPERVLHALSLSLCRERSHVIRTSCCRLVISGRVCNRRVCTGVCLEVCKLHATAGATRVCVPRLLRKKWGERNYFSFQKFFHFSLWIHNRRRGFSQGTLFFWFWCASFLCVLYKKYKIALFKFVFSCDFLLTILLTILHSILHAILYTIPR